ncbi:MULTISPECIES: V-type ATPase subunit [Thermotoga]|uniref:H+transporting two-sector ATPase C (AC39) subunit n=1 Tax=Thermotoga neapolitana (strain ATCC 49049 / DSM 4359 / NBRC 107923 / NS-E) TaxID=309803 RepID=B9K808_THENN|nr:MULTISPECIES: V-type ATPase subunit [Thermotoga]ACM23091.1 H+transporting two-sector ATPase C (AC39) subunit [Thermotoga neapolitana DSM 4359]AJG41006.1 ATPase [Thermotoga sp. RQ7]KFZ21900.1 H+transporting two-sector ATPase C (AC39) subunit [Thermotoga neapolitana LA10]HBF11628.1 ATPase [Thermotoga neapolitana]
MRFASLSAKVKAMKSKMLTRDDFEQLMKTKSVVEIADYLKQNTHYREILKEVDVSKLHRRDLEILLRGSIVQDLYKVYFYLPNDAKRIFLLFEKKFEIENIKFAIRVIHSGHPENLSESKLYPVYHKSIDEARLLSVKNMEELWNVLKESEYYAGLESAYRNYQNSGKVHHLLNALDLWYFLTVKRRLSSTSLYAQGFKHLFYTHIDLTNIQWVYRARLLFKLQTPEVLNLLTPFQGYLKKQFFSELSTVSSTNEFLKKLMQTPYGRYFEDMEESKLPFTIERICDRVLLDRAERLSNDVQNGCNVAVGYVYIREYEYKDLVTIIETKRYGLSSEEAKYYLVIFGEW